MPASHEPPTVTLPQPHGEPPMSIARDVIMAPARLTLGYGERLLTDIRPDQFARTPNGVQTNHPAWVFGHLSVYPDAFILPLIGRPELAAPDESLHPLFGHDSQCRDDPNGEIYPSMKEITARYLSRTDAALTALAEVDDAALLAATPESNPLRERLPTVGSVVNFMLGPHSMMHLGQVSAWRRMMGLGPCM
ncbi:MAG: DinB family protein [Phycisphaeraceae bacterium]|nr:MAG: DinB family protein [Phycisphaeraceae bacterium]